MMSSEIAKTQKRTYRKRRRAELEAQTRERITEAAVELHGTVGAARTTISAIAERAGVQRATVHRHFPDDTALFAACTRHWRDRNPRPDPSTWAKIESPADRLRRALGELYRWYAEAGQMLELSMRDAPVVPALQESMKVAAAYQEAVVDVLLRGRRERGAARRRVRAAIGHVISFETWRSLVRRQGLSEPEAVELIAGLVDPPRTPSKLGSP